MICEHIGTLQAFFIVLFAISVAGCLDLLARCIGYVRRRWRAPEILPAPTVEDELAEFYGTYIDDYL